MKDTLSEALSFKDPSGALEPGSRQYNVIEEMIEGGIRQHGPEQALEMARKSARHFDVGRKFLRGMALLGGKILWTEQGLHRMRCQLNARSLSVYGILAQAHNRRRIERPQRSAADFPFDDTVC